VNQTAAGSGRPVQVKDVQPGTAGFELVLALAVRVLAQDRYVTWHFPDALESHVLGLIQVLGAEAGRRAVIHNDESLKEGYVEAFGVDPQLRRRGIGTALQQHAAQQCRIAGCYQMRSRSSVTSTENYALKIAAGMSCIPARKTIPTTSSCACNQPRGMSHVAWFGRPMTPRNILSCRR
jgi:GNAT superfamily N-acetyltransferase